MKSIITLSILCWLSAASVWAQPTLTAASNMPTVGLRSTTYNANQFAAGNAGASQTWDFSALNFSAPAAGTYQPCNSTNGCSMHTGATMAHIYSSLRTYYKTTANTLALQGFFNGGANTYYSNPEDYLRFPFAYGNSFVDSFAGSYNGGSPVGTWYRRGVDTVTADGWGTLKTPAGTFPNTLRVKRVSTYLDSGITSSPTDRIQYKSYTYTWYSTTHKDFLYTTAEIFVTPKYSSTTTVSYSRYTVNQNVGVEAPAFAGLRCEVAPNPARGSVQMTISLDAPRRASVSLTDITGREVRSIPDVDLSSGENKLSLPAEGLPGGVYFLRVMAGDAVRAVKVVLE